MPRWSRIARATHGRVTPEAGIAWEAASFAYVTSSFGFFDKAGRAVPLKSCGSKPAARVLQLCLVGSAPDLGALTVRNSLFDGAPRAG